METNRRKEDQAHTFLEKQLWASHWTERRSSSAAILAAHTEQHQVGAIHLQAPVSATPISCAGTPVPHGIPSHFVINWLTWSYLPCLCVFGRESVMLHVLRHLLWDFWVTFHIMLTAVVKQNASVWFMAIQSKLGVECQLYVYLCEGTGDQV